ncbi:hypothetical protein L6452_39241 [Arctium lappa]|uniref:Uncharacterized protein n=1 Tax=Arctium lappa TaxID=4217 RepID=A0ACB8XSG9_ARCLA|nr:hypothetical protein L6452_39241 [Arctium lappa]
MFLSSKSPPLMTNEAATCFPDLSLQISPPAAAVLTGNCITKNPRSSSSSSSSSDLSQENTFKHHHKSWTAAADDHMHMGHCDHQPRLNLRLEMGALNHHHHHHPNIINTVVPLQPQHHHRYHLPRIYGHDFKARSRMVKCTMYRTVKSTDKGAAGLLSDQMQVINSKTSLPFLEVKGGISISPPTALQSQRRSWTSSLETNDSHYPMKEHTSSDHCPSPLIITNDSTKADEVEVVTLHMSKKMKLRTNSSSLDSEKMLNLDFTLGSRQIDQIF